MDNMLSNGGIALIVAVIGVFLNLLTLRQIVRQNNNYSEATKAEITYKIAQSHQNIFMTLLEKEDMMKYIFESDNESENTQKVIGTLLINHSELIFTYAQKGLLDDDEWLGVQNDMADLFKNWPIVALRWPSVKTYYSREFQEFINSLIEHGRTSSIKRAFK